MRSTTLGLNPRICARIPLAEDDDQVGPYWRGKRPVAVNLLDRLGSLRADILRFSVDFRVPFSNNAAEQDIRPVKIREKISGCLRSLAGTTTFCALRSYLSTTRKQGRDALTALRELQEGQPWLPDPATC